MAKIQLDVQELIEFRDRLIDKNRIERLLKDLAKELMENIRKLAEDNSPVDTGRLMLEWSSGENIAMQVSKQGNVYTVSIENKAYNPNGGSKEENRYYASFVEVGHYTVNGNWWEGYHFLADAEDKTIQKANQIAEGIIRDWWRWLNG